MSTKTETEKAMIGLEKITKNKAVGQSVDKKEPIGIGKDAPSNPLEIKAAGNIPVFTVHEQYAKLKPMVKLKRLREFLSWASNEAERLRDEIGIDDKY